MDIESIYYKNDSPIPVLIHLTGPNTGLSISLVQEEPNNNLSQIERVWLLPEVWLFPELNLDKTERGDHLVGNALDYGTYNVFINTTDLTAGYYELRCIRPYYEVYGACGFYLLNSSQKQYNEERKAS